MGLPSARTSRISESSAGSRKGNAEWGCAGFWRDGRVLTDKPAEEEHEEYVAKQFKELSVRLGIRIR